VAPIADIHISDLGAPDEKTVAGFTRGLVIRIPLAILGRRHPNMADEGAAQRVGIGKAAAHGYLLRGLAPKLQEAPRCCQKNYRHTQQFKLTVVFLVALIDSKTTVRNTVKKFY
jgi:hypothetical protein